MSRTGALEAPLFTQPANEGSVMLGKEIRDKVTGLHGICTGRAEYLFGCTQYNIVPKLKDGESKLEDTLWFDEGRLEVIGPGVAAADVTVDAPGGPQRDAPGS